MIGLDVEMPDEKTPSSQETQEYKIKTIVVGGMVGGGGVGRGVALAMGFPTTLPVVSMMTRLALLMTRDQKSTARSYEIIGNSLLPEIIASLCLALDLIDGSQKSKYWKMFEI